MKMIILAGGQRSTISDDVEGLAKPMLPIGGRPLLWHIMKHASLCGINDFIVCGGYKIETIKDYFLDFYIYQSDIKVDTKKNTVEILNQHTEDWNVTIVDTGMNASPVERVKKVLDFVDDNFLISYGDCLSNISFSELINLHENESKGMTIALARPTGRKMPIRFLGNSNEWGSGDEAWTSAGTFVANKDFFRKVSGQGDIEEILDEAVTTIYRHKGFFSSIETVRDKVAAEAMWKKGEADWMDVI